ncbi:MAG: hypothetical protein Q9213_003566 [Squamulea squamosa]
MAQEPQFTVFIRLPFPRGDFVDPPPVKWDSSKDQTLWDILSRTSKGREIDWHALSVNVLFAQSGRLANDEIRASQFDVDLAFLLQQAAWLYERQLSQVKAQLRKVSKPSLTAQSPTPSLGTGSGATGGHAMARTSSGGARMSRNSSTNTVHQIQKASPTLAQRPSTEALSPAIQSSRAREASRRLSDLTQKDRPPVSETPESSSSKADNSSSSSSESEAAPLSRSRAYMRRPRHSNSKAPLGPLSDADEDDADSPPFLPFSDPKAINQPPPNDPGATLRTAPQFLSNKLPTPAAPALTSSSSSAQSSQPSKKPPKPSHRNPTSPPHHHSNEPASALSPRQRRVVKDGSEGTPSMGSSFSDLDDASVTQSALEEALAHEMNQGGVASRMSTISQALRSRYL